LSCSRHCAEKDKGDKGKSKGGESDDDDDDDEEEDVSDRDLGF
jgi:hypothetical protein